MERVTMTCDEFEEISGAYVLDAVTPAEREAAEAHLAGCVKCTHLLQELRGVVSLLPLSAPQIKPPEELKERIMSSVRQESQGEVAEPARPQPIAAFRPVRSGSSAQPARRTRGGVWNLRVLVAAAVLMFSLLGGLSAWNISLHGQVVSLQQQLSQATANRSTTQFTSYLVKSTAQSQSAAGQLIYFAQQNITVLVMHGLPQLQGAHVYQGWLLRLDGKKITSVTSIGLLNPQSGSETLSFEGDVTGYDAAAISLEPGPGATPKAPQGSVIALGSLKTNSH
jgi:anti-sigma-K factor RskA